MTDVLAIWAASPVFSYGAGEAVDFGCLLLSFVLPGVGSTAEIILVAGCSDVTRAGAAIERTLGKIILKISLFKGFLV